MQSYIFWTLVLVVLALISAGIAFFARSYLNGMGPSSLLFRQKGERRRLEVVDHANVDSRRKLILIRRDGVEHLVMTGGPVDVVIETGITPPAPQPVEAAPAREHGIFRRPPMFRAGGPRPANPNGEPQF